MKFSFICKVIEQTSALTYEVLTSTHNKAELPITDYISRSIKADTLLPLTYIYAYDATYDAEENIVTIHKFCTLDIEKEEIIPDISPIFSEKIKEMIQNASSFPVDLFKL